MTGDAVKLGFGCARLGSAAAGLGRRESIRLVQAAADRGITYFDTADAYGAGISESILGAALVSCRSAVTIATKGGYLFAERSTIEQHARAVAGAVVRRLRSAPVVGGRSLVSSASKGGYSRQDFSPEYLTRALDASRRRLRADRIDVYQLHGPRGADPDRVIEWANRALEAGRIGAFGIGAETLSQASDWQGSKPVSLMQVPFGVLDPAAGTALIPALHSAGRTVVTRGVLAAGLLVGPRTVGPDDAHKIGLIRAVCALAASHGLPVIDLALGYVRRRTDVDVIVVGTTSVAHVAELSSTMERPVPDQELLGLLDALIAAEIGTAHGD